MIGAGVIFALVAIALAPLANWILGEASGQSAQGSSAILRRFVVLVYLLAIVAALAIGIRGVGPEL